MSLEARRTKSTKPSISLINSDKNVDAVDCAFTPRSVRIKNWEGEQEDDNTRAKQQSQKTTSIDLIKPNDYNFFSFFTEAWRRRKNLFI